MGGVLTGLRSKEDGEPGADWREDVRSRGVSRHLEVAHRLDSDTYQRACRDRINRLRRSLACCLLRDRLSAGSRADLKSGDYEGSTAPSVVGVCWTRDRRTSTEAGRKERL